jgi:K(+)-stimulated pyrophosphate-energized sodium pump
VRGKSRKWLLPAAALAATVVLLLVVSAYAGEGAKAESPVSAVSGTLAKSVPWANTEMELTILWMFAPLGALAGIIGAWVCYRLMMKADEGDEKMKKIAGHVRDGARAYLTRQYKVVAIVFGVLFVFFGVLSFGLGVLPKLVPFAFLTGGFFSGLCGWIGMNTATRASNRTAAGAKQSLNRGLQVAFQSGAVMGLIVVGLGLLDICLWFAALYWLVPEINPKWALELDEITVIMLCFGMGASLQALFARVGGGIFTKAADVGADLVGKVEAGIPEDDPRNPATIADNVGDNVGDVAGMGADLYESFCGSILATAALGVAAYHGAKGMTDAEIKVSQLGAAFLPMVIAGVGVLLSAVCVGLVRTKEGATQKQLLAALGRAVNISAVGIAALSFGVILLIRGWDGMGVWGSVVAGLLTGIIIGKATEYFTAADYKPTQRVAASTQTGPATVIIEGLAVGMESTWVPVVAVCVGTISAYLFAGGAVHIEHGLYGVGIAAVGMLSTLGLTLATDAYGPIADNAGGNAEMSGQPAEVRERTDALDSLGNTTAATGKGFAIGSAALTALALMAAYIEELRSGLRLLGEKADVTAVTAAGSNGLHLLGEKVRGVTHEGKVAVEVFIRGEWVALSHMKLAQFMDFYEVNLLNPYVLVGMFLGGMTAFLFCSMTLKAVGRAAQAMVEEVRRQFRTIKGLMEGTAEADYATCVDIATKGAQKEMMLPSMLAVIIPVATGLVLGPAGVLGLLAGGLVTGFTLAVFMANSGGSWDNAKKYIETGKHGGKGSDNHKAGVVGDTVGDPFKDTSGPSLNILIKLMSMVSVVAAGLVVSYGGWLQKLAALLKSWSEGS